MKASPVNAIVRHLLPAFIEVAEGPIDAIKGPSWREETIAVAGAVEKRRAEFMAGRILARRALSRLGAGDGPLLADENRVPRWPAGFTGSISHSATYAAVAVARLADVAGLGIDVEQAGRLTPELETQILSVDEIDRQLAPLGPAERMDVATAMFCAKEAYYKAQYRLAGRRLGFHDVEVLLDLAAGAFDVRHARGPASPHGGRFAIIGGLIAAALWFPALASTDV